MTKKIRHYDIAFLVILLVVFSVLFWKSHIGIANIDEAFHLTVPYRMARWEDWLIVNEWHVSQMWSFLLYPVMRIYQMLIPGTEGIVLAFRYMFVFFQLCVMVISYVVLRKQYRVLAVAIPVIYGMFVPFNVMNFNYNSLGYAITYLLVVLNLRQTDRVFQHIVSGILLAGLVLCNPYTVLIYVVWVIVELFRREQKRLLYTHIGIGILACMFLSITLTRTSIPEVLVNIPNIMSDAAHEPKTLIGFLDPIIRFVWDYEWYSGPLIILLSLIIFDKKRRKWWIECLILFTILVTMLFSTRPAINGGIGINVIMLPYTPMGLIIFSFLKEKNWRIFWIGLIFPVLYAMCMNWSSNQGIYVIADGCAVSSMISLIIVAQWLEENQVQYKYLVTVLIACITAQLMAELYIKVNHAFWEDNVSDLKYEIEVGPMRGLKTSEKKKIDHENTIHDIRSLNLNSDNYVLYYQYFSWGYLVADARFGTFSAWTEAENALYSEKFVKYYELNPEKVPNVIYMDVEGYQTWTPEQWETYCVENGYTIRKTDVGNYLLMKN